MGWDAWFVLALVVLIFFALARSLAPPDVLLCGGAVAVALAGILTPEDIFQGLTNQGMLTVAALFVVAAGLRETGALEIIGGRILGRTRSDRVAMLRMSIPVLGMSAFLNNTPVVAMFMNLLSDWCRRRRIAPSKLMMPLSYLAILGGTCTLIGTSTNLVVNGMMIDRSEVLSEQASQEADPHLQTQLTQTARQLEGMSLFEMSWFGVPIAMLGLAYLVLFGRRLLPDRKDLLEQLGESPREYLVDMVIQPGCRLEGKRIEEAGLRHLAGLFLIEVARGDQVISPVGPDFILQTHDRLTFTGVVSTIVDLERIPGLVPAADASYESEGAKRRDRLLCEAVISSTSPLIGKNIREANFRAFYNAAVVAVHRGGVRLHGRIGDIILRPGDTLLLQAGTHFAKAHRNNRDFYLVSGIETSRPIRHERATLSLILLAALVILMASAWMPIVMAAFLVAGLMIGTRCIGASAARQSVDWQVLLTIVGALALAQALQKTGAAEAVAHVVVQTTESIGPRASLLAVYLMATVLTELVTNNAAAALIFPFAVVVAQDLGISPRPFVIAVAFGASASLLTPIGYQTNMMVYGPGGYRFTDFTRVGLPLSIMLCIVATVFIPVIWPF